MLKIQRIAARQSLQTVRMASSLADYAQYKTLNVTQPVEYVVHVEMNRPDKLNALNTEMWKDLGVCFQQLHEDAECRSVVLSGAGRLFSSGIDLSDLMAVGSVAMGDGDVSRKAFKLHRTIKNYQDWFTDIEKCRKPVIAAVHGACVGGGVDMVTAADVRLCSQDAFFQVKEVDIGLAADEGTLQRLPKVIGSRSLVNELCLTARRLGSQKALQCGLVSRVLSDRQVLLAAAISLAATIAQKSPVAVQSTKQNLIFSRDHTVQDGLDHMVAWNAAMLQSEDIMKAATASMDRKAPPADFAKL
ncbi:delta(3,5)-Delta(2,4)-dienoyl-CoA isomerase, mitochondrial-like [Pollicipes pollicipes]|uniref:delta(3,5)-Delta(2,4)-dienoyl-CoA isomerase, mitochondrial-like n=1 Tax=Pollicipes pollicipes TaxID=41117 RepID=UPI001884FACE|nr:delta(3,5)-Delta(2,4)-dienoyl-CoA isomerase, mitochondrial-like [Pollicipes pollicipes]